jgi:hypothetical protein
VPRSWKKHLRISVRALIALVLVFGTGLGWVVRSARIQREAVAGIRRAGGVVVYAYPRDGLGTCSLAAEPRRPGPSVPRWLETAIGVDYFSHPFQVVFEGTGSDNDLSHVGRLESLELLWIEDTDVTDAGIAHLKRLTGLTFLSLAHTKVSDAGLVHVESLTQLEDLDVQQTLVTAAGIRQLRQAMPRLRVFPHVPL